MPHLLELFSGTGSVGRAFRAKGWEVTSVDCDRAADATIQQDVRDLDVSNLGEIDAILASPPCTNYSVARRSAETTAEDLGTSDGLVRKTLEIAGQLGNPALFVENPWTGGLKSRGLLDP